MRKALTKEGEMVSLNLLNSNQIHEMQHNKFRCPGCQKDVKLRKNRHKSWYFAHVKTYGARKKENLESKLHIEGKQSLFQWIRVTDPSVKLEPYQKESKQFPDLKSTLNHENYAIEYQCAKIPLNSLRRRTEKYIMTNQIPIWIIGQDSPLSHSFVSGEMYKYFQDTFTKLPVIYQFNPPYQYLEVHTALAAFSPHKMFVSTRKYSTSTPFYTIIGQDTIFPLGQNMIDYWVKQKKRHRLSPQQTPTKLFSHLFKYFFLYGMNVSLLPSLVGIPTHYSYHMYSSSIEWQLWFDITILRPLDVGQFLSTKILKQKWIEAIQKDLIRIHELPLVYKTNHFDAILSYLAFLDFRGIISLYREGFKKRSNLPISNHIEKALAQDSVEVKRAVQFFYKKSQQLEELE